MSDNKLTFKQKALKTTFYVSFLPVVIFLLKMIRYMVEGIVFIDTYVSGFNALILCLIIGFLFLPIFIPCLIFQVVFIMTTCNKREYKQYNTKKCILILLTLLILAFITEVVINKVEDWKYKYEYRYQVRKTEVFILPYDRDFKDDLNTFISGNYDDMVDFAREHESLLTEDFKSICSDFHPYCTLLVSDKIEGKPICTEDNIKIKYSEGYETFKVITDYDIDKEYSDDYIIVCLISSLPTKSFDLILEWLEN